MYDYSVKSQTRKNICSKKQLKLCWDQIFCGLRMLTAFDWYQPINLSFKNRLLECRFQDTKAYLMAGKCEINLESNVDMQGQSVIFEPEALISSCFKLTPNYTTVTKAADWTFKTIKLNNFKIVIYIYFKNRDVYFFFHDSASKINSH